MNSPSASSKPIPDAGAAAPSSPPDRDAELQRLRDLLVGDQAARLQRVEAALADRARHVETVAEVLPEALDRAERERAPALETALRQPLIKVLLADVRENPGEIVGILYPVILPAIRQAIQQALRGFLERIDTLITRQFSLDALRWRLEAMRSGVPYAEVVLRHTVEYRVVQALLIQSRTGLLIAHVHTEDAKDVDSDAVSAMLTALEAFVHDAFQNRASGELERVTVGDHIVYLAHGPQATLACVVQGVASPQFLERMQQALDALHLSHGEQLASFQGDPLEDERLTATLRGLLETRYRQSERDQARVQRQMKLLGWGALLGTLALAGWLGWRAWDHHRAERWAAAVDAAPGIVVHDVAREGGAWRLRGLRDPAAADPAELLREAGGDPQRVRFDLEPYQSLEPAIVERRLTRAWQLPDGVRATLDGQGRAHLTGLAPPDWLRDFLARRAPVAGVTGLDLSALRVAPTALRAEIEREIGLPEGVTLAVEDGVLRVQGEATRNWRRRLQALAAGLAPVLRLDDSGLRPGELRALRELAGRLEAEAVRFAKGTARPDSEGEAALFRLAGLVDRFRALAARLGQPYLIHVRGHAPGSGTPARNRQLQRERAAFLLNWLVAQGVPPARVTLELPAKPGAAPAADLRIDLPDGDARS